MILLTNNIKCCASESCCPLTRAWCNYGSFGCCCFVLSSLGLPHCTSSWLQSMTLRTDTFPVCCYAVCALRIRLYNWQVRGMERGFSCAPKKKSVLTSSAFLTSSIDFRTTNFFLFVCYKWCYNDTMSYFDIVASLLSTFLPVHPSTQPCVLVFTQRSAATLRE